jgi:hypothetical protein
MNGMMKKGNEMSECVYHEGRGNVPKSSGDGAGCVPPLYGHGRKPLSINPNPPYGDGIK